MYKNATSDPSASSNGLIVCTASNAGLYPFPVAPLYASTKSGVIGLVRSLARRLEQDKIRINALAPAVIGELFLKSNIKTAINWSRNQYRTKRGSIQADDYHTNVNGYEGSGSICGG